MVLLIIASNNKFYKNTCAHTCMYTDRRNPLSFIGKCKILALNIRSGYIGPVTGHVPQSYRSGNHVN